ncbi:uncharacterized protein [Penaeus vannamei]|uniref:uncharacterized protein n=1 Tax=Penaeus vannamei TaxID=6689 RepID=UPI00387FA52A
MASARLASPLTSTAGPPLSPSHNNSHYTSFCVYLFTDHPRGRPHKYRGAEPSRNNLRCLVPRGCISVTPAARATPRPPASAATAAAASAAASGDLERMGPSFPHSNKDQIDSLVNTVRIFSEDIKMEFGLSKCGELIIKRGKVVESDGLCMPDGAMMRNVEESGYKYLGVLEVDGIKHDQMKDQVKKEYTRRVRNILKSKLNGGNIISAINSRAVSVVRYGAGIIKWTKNELEEMDRKTRKLMTMYGAQHPKADVDRLYLKRYDGGRGLLGVEDCVQAEVNSLDKYLRASEENMLKGKSTIIAAQDQALCTGNLRKRVYGEDIDSSCRVCGAAEETVAHIVSECQKLALKEYKEPEKVLESDECKILWDFPIQTDKTLEHNRPDITVIEKNSKKCLLIDPACPFDTRIERKEEKCNNYCDLKYEIARMWRMKEVEVIPVVVGALGSVTKDFEKWVQKLDLGITAEMLQKPCLLGTARIIRKVLDMK